MAPVRGAAGSLPPAYGYQQPTRSWWTTSSTICFHCYA
uniref:Uncharacterized protein n=1 Tax=Setaria viridis TaxID=4556 RepID=A0A4U6SSP6_SETVI|nr:hypothetical protein SEVIR_9G106700v2 [Setaria viridis]